MAKREVSEINAGSMADIAFLLLIFFLVTTTMEVDAGIGRQLPLKIERNDDIDYPPVNERNVLKIMANRNDELLVEDNRIELGDLQEVVENFYLDNISGIERNKNMPLYTKVTISECNKQIVAAKELIEGAKDDVQKEYFQKELEKWETKLLTCKELPSKEYMEMHKSAVIQLINQGGTSYGLYIEIQNILKIVVNDLRVKKCEEMGWKNYFELDAKEEADQKTIKMLRVLVPERIIEKVED